MKAVSIQQPWAELVVTGRQIWFTFQHENAYTGRIAIVSPKGMSKDSIDACYIRPVADFISNPTLLPKGKLVGFADLVSCKPALMVLEMAIQPNYGDLKFNLECGGWEHGWFAYEFRNPAKIPMPMPCRGMNHIWKLDLEEMQLVRDSEEAIEEAAKLGLMFHACPTCNGTGRDPSKK